MQTPIRTLAAFLVVFLVAATPIPAAAADYPEKPIELLVPWPAGGVSDTLMRLIAGPLGTHLGQPVVIVNKPGAAGVIGMHELEKAPADGYTIGNIATSQVATQYTSANPNDLKRLVPVARLVSGVGTLTVKSDAAWSSLADYVDYAKKNPGKLRVANSGTGGVTHVHGLAFDRALGIKQTHIPFKGNAAVLPALAGGHVEATMIAITDVLPMVKGGQLKLLALGGKARHPLFSTVPTFIEAGLPFDLTNFQGLAAPKGVLVERLQKIEDALARVMMEASVTKALEERGYSIDFQRSREFSQFLEEQDELFRSLIDARK
jgi:tripartite-type tricarboxylate transporter receptor subunit TctC